jgi:hypothetical protein
MSSPGGRGWRRQRCAGEARRAGGEEELSRAASDPLSRSSSIPDAREEGRGRASTPALGPQRPPVTDSPRTTGACLAPRSETRVLHAQIVDEAAVEADGGGVRVGRVRV